MPAPATPTTSPAPFRRRDHDAFFKQLFQAHFRELLELACPAAARRLRFDKVRFLSQETFSDLCGGRVQRLDVVALVPALDGEARLVIVHVEIQERPGREPFGERMLRYYMGLRLRHRLKVLPIVVWFSPGKGGLGFDVHREEVLGEEVLRFRYRRIGVAGLPAARYLRGKNPLGYGLAIRMRRGRLSKVALQLACEKRIAQAPIDDHRRLLLYNCVQTYSPLTPEEKRELQAQLRLPEYKEVRKMLTWAEKLERKGERKGIAKGELRSAARMVRTAWVQRFGALARTTSAKIGAIKDPDRLEALLGAIIAAKDEAVAKRELTRLATSE